MNLLISDNIIAEITPAGRAAVSGIRINGKNAKDIVQKIFNTKITKARHAYFVEHELDEVVIVYYESPNSYTGDNVCEIFCHGNPAIVNNIIDSMLSVNDFKVRMANPGEFTKRAYLNNKIDLLQAEAVVDIINSSSLKAAKYRNHVLRGDFSKILNSIKEDLVDISVFTELEIDFEEEKAGILDIKKAEKTLLNVSEKIKNILSSFCRIEALSKDIKVVILGDANVGKSSLFNKLIEYERSIVHEHPGTTRDYIEAEVLVNDLEITFIDTAGFREKINCEVEKQGIDRIKDLIDTATLIIEVVERDDQIFKYPQAVHIRNKIDINKPFKNDTKIIYVSAKNDIGIKELKEYIRSELSRMFDVKDERADFFLLTKRQKVLLNELKIRVENVLTSINRSEPIDAISFLIRNAIAVINDLLGKEKVSDDTLNELFSRFCIGK